MSISYQINVTETATDVLAELASASARRKLNKDLGQRAANELREHFRERNLSGPRNKLGARSSGFWNDIRSAVQNAEPTDDGATINIAHEAIAQKVYGGPIKADDKRLAIPARTEAYGKSPRLFTNLKLIVFGNTGAMALAQKKIKEKRQRGEKRIGKARDVGLVFYWLVNETRSQAPDPNALPSEAVMGKALEDTAAKHFQRIRDRRNQTDSQS